MTDNANSQSARLLPLRAYMLVFLLMVFGVVFSTGTLAQEIETAPKAPETTLSYEALADVLANDEVRDKLVNELRTLATENGNIVSNTEGVQDPNLQNSATSFSEPNRFIASLQAFTQRFKHDITKSWDILRSLIGGDARQFEQLNTWKSALFNLLITIIAVIFAYLIFRRMAVPIFRHFDNWARRQPSSERLNAIHRKQIKRDHERKNLAEAVKAQQIKAQVETQSETVSSEFAHLQTEEAQNITPEPDPAHGTDPHQAVKHFSLRYTKLRKLSAVIMAFAVDLATIIAAVIVGYIVVLALPSTNQNQSATLLGMQFLTAFFAIEVIKAISRMLFSSKYDKLRLMPTNEKSAAYWNRWVATVVTVGGYGLLVLVPVLQTVLSVALANIIGALLILVVYLYAISVLWSNRQSVSNALLQQAEQTTNTFLGTVLRISSKLWLWVALLYFTVLFVVTQADQQNAIGFMAKASAQTLVSLLVGAVLSLALGSLVTHRLHLSAHWNQSFPLLEQRLNAYIPAIFNVLRLIVFAGVLLSIFDAWQVFDLQDWLSSTHGKTILSTIIQVLVVLIIAVLSWTVFASIIEHRLSSSTSRIPTEREKTLLMLFRNALAIVIVTMTALIVLSQVGIDIGPLIAGAGVIGLAIGFGAQKLVQDVITGVFIQLENGMNQNDVVEVAGLFGVVEKLTIRSVVIRTLDGGYHLVPFSSIDCVANHTRDYGYHHGEYLISLRESVDDAIEHLKAAFVDLKKDPEVCDAILEDITIPGVSALGKDGASIRVLIKTTPGMQWAVQRSFNRLVKLHFDAAGIEIPYPQTVLHFGRDKNGTAAPANIQMIDAVAQASKDHKVVSPRGAASVTQKSKEVFQDGIADVDPET